MRAPAAAMPDWLAARAVTHADRLAVVAGGERLTFAELDRRAGRAAAQLASAGARPGDRVALLLPNGLAFVVLTHALARLGAVMVPLNTRLAPAEVAWQVRDARPGLLVYDERFGAQVAALGEAPGAEPGTGPPAADDGRPGTGAGPGGVAPGAGQRLLLVADLEALPPVAPPPVASAPTASSAAASSPTASPLPAGTDLSAPQGIIYTSATAGRPKGVLLSFGNHWWNAVGSALHLGLDRRDRWLAPLPLFHVGGLAILWRSVIYGIPAVVHETFDPNAVNQAIDCDEVTIVSVVATMLQRMLDARGARPYPRSLRCVLLGGGPAPAPLLERCLRLGVPVAPTYGLTEAASQVATLLPDEVERRPDSAGKPVFPTAVRIEDGEILVRGPSVMLGYADRPVETAEVLRDGWLRTGDLGRLDEGGYLYVLDRREDLIVTGGENVYPAEVEAVLAAHPAVAEAGVVGVPDATWGQAVAAAVRLRPGVAAEASAITAFCRERLAGYKVPRRVWFVDELPRSPSGKLLRRRLRERLRDLVTSQGLPATDRPGRGR